MEAVLPKSYKHLPSKVSSWTKTPPGLMTAYVHYKDSSALTMLGFCQHTTIKLMVWLQLKKNLIVCIHRIQPSDLSSLLTTLRQLSTQQVGIFHVHISSTDFCQVTVVSITTLEPSLRSCSLQHPPCWRSHFLLDQRLAAATQKAPTQRICSNLKSMQFTAIYTDNSESSVKFLNATKLPVNFTTFLCSCRCKTSWVTANPTHTLLRLL